MITRLGAVAAALCTVAVTAGCAHHTVAGPTVYTTITVTPGPTSSPTTSPVASSRTHTAPPAAMHQLPGTCTSLLPFGSIIDAVGHNIAGGTAFVVGLPDASTGRISYLNCRYGIRHGAPAAVEIGVSLYRTPARAAARISPTVDDFTAHAARATTTTVDALPATVLTGGQGSDYAPTIVLADGQRTVAVTLRSGSGAPSGDLVRLAELAVRATAAG